MKQTKKRVALAIATILSLSTIGGTVAKASTQEELYKVAFDAMTVAQKEKTQTAINKAREAIKGLPKEMIAARGEFSKQIDEVQQPIFSNVVRAIMELKNMANGEAIKSAGETGIQLKINEVRPLLLGVEPAYANSWSSALDEVQNKLIKKAIDAVNANAAYKAMENEFRAQMAIRELQKSTNQDVVNYANALNELYKQGKSVDVNANNNTGNYEDSVVGLVTASESVVLKDSIVWSHGSIKDKVGVVSVDAELLSARNCTIDGHTPDFGDTYIAVNSNTVFKNINKTLSGSDIKINSAVSLKVKSITIINDQDQQETINLGGKQIRIVFNNSK